MATNVNFFRTLSQNITKKVNAGNTTTTEEFTNLSNAAQLLKLSNDYETFVKTKVISNYLQTFLKTDQVFSVNPNNPIVPYPSDYQYMSSVGSYYDGTQIDCQLVDNADWREMLRPNSLNYPTKRFPKYQQKDDGVLFAPKDIGTIYFDYFKTPIVPVWGYTIVNNRQVYDPTTSVDFEWDNFALNEIMAIYLQFIGISLKDTEIAAYAAQYTQETNLTI